MIRLLTQQDVDSVRSYLDRDPLHNIYMIHGLQAYGLESERVTFWGAFGGDRLEGILFAKTDGESRFGCLAGDDPRVSARLGNHALKSEITALIGKDTYIQPVVDRMRSRFRMRVKHLLFEETHPEQLKSCHDYLVRLATEADIPLLVELYRGYEFSRRDRTDEEIAREIRSAMDESGIYFFVELDGRAVSAARIMPETDRAGIIGAVRTLPEFRGRGIYPCVRTACYEYLFRQGKVGLAYILDTNESMIRVIKKQGGTLAAKWLLVDFKERLSIRQRILPQRLRRWGARIRDRVLHR